MRGKTPEERAKAREEAEKRRDPEKDRSAHNDKRGLAKRPSESIKMRLSIDEYGAAYAALNTEGDRGAAIMGAALVEDGLRQGIISRLQNPQDAKRLFKDQGSPFGTFRNKIVSAFALGLIGESISDEIDCIREIRNRFSHELTVVTFEDIYISGRCKKLVQHCNDPTLYEDWDNDAIRFVYIKACKSILGTILRETLSNRENRQKSQQT